MDLYCHQYHVVACLIVKICYDNGMHKFFNMLPLNLLSIKPQMHCKYYCTSISGYYYYGLWWQNHKTSCFTGSWVQNEALHLKHTGLSGSAGSYSLTQSAFTRSSEEESLCSLSTLKGFVLKLTLDHETSCTDLRFMHHPKSAKSGIWGCKKI